MDQMRKNIKVLLPVFGCLGFLVMLSAVGAFVYLFFRPLPFGPLQKAAHDGDLAMVKSLIDSGTPVDVRCAFMNWTALHTAAAAGQFDVAKFLIDHGANLELRDDKGFTPLALTGCQSSYRSYSKDTEFGRNEIASMLIERGANVNAKTNLGETPRTCAGVYGNDPELERILREAGGH